MKLEIHELFARSAYALDERDLSMLDATFAADCKLVIDIAGTEGVVEFDGHEAVMDLMRSSMEEQKDKRRHAVSNIFFTEVSAQRASAVSNLIIYSIDEGAIRAVSSGLYFDTVIQENGGWAIAERTIKLDLPY